MRLLASLVASKTLKNRGFLSSVIKSGFNLLKDSFKNDPKDSEGKNERPKRRLSESTPSLSYEISHESRPKTSIILPSSITDFNIPTPQAFHKEDNVVIEILREVRRIREILSRGFPTIGRGIYTLSDDIRDQNEYIRENLLGKFAPFHRITRGGDKKFLSKIPTPDKGLMEEIAEMFFGSIGTYFPSLLSILGNLGMVRGGLGGVVRGTLGFLERGSLSRVASGVISKVGGVGGRAVLGRLGLVTALAYAGYEGIKRGTKLSSRYGLSKEDWKENVPYIASKLIPFVGLATSIIGHKDKKKRLIDKTLFQSAAGGIGSLIFMGDQFEDWAGKLFDFTTGIEDRLSNVVSSTVNTFTVSFPREVQSALGSIGSSFYEDMKNIWNDIIFPEVEKLVDKLLEGIKKPFEQIADAGSTLIDAGKSFVENLFHIEGAR